MSNLDQYSVPLLAAIKQLIEESRKQVAVYINISITVLYWNIGKHIQQQLFTSGRAAYGKDILQTVSAKLTDEYGKGFSER